MPKVTDTILRSKIVQGTANNLKKLLTKAEPTAADRISKGTQAISARLNSEAAKTEVIKDLVAERGTGSIVDIPINLVRMFPTVKKVLPDDKYRDLLYSYQQKLVSADQKAGEALASKSKTLKKLLTVTDFEPDVSVITDDNKVVQAFVPKERRRLTAPVDKAKTFALPMLALYGLNGVINPPDSDKDKVAQETDLRNTLVEKLAGTITNLVPQPALSSNALEKIARASDLLKKASYKISDLEEQNEKLASEVQDLKNRLFAKERSVKAVKLANEMVRKGILKQSAVASQVDYIMGLDEDGFRVLNKTVGDVPDRKADVSTGSVEKLSCLMVDPYTDYQSEPPSLEDAILQYGN